MVLGTMILVKGGGKALFRPGTQSTRGVDGRPNMSRVLKELTRFFVETWFCTSGSGTPSK